MSEKSKNKLLINCLVTIFLGYFGIHKFMEKKTGLGFLYLFTFGLFGIGWMVDSIISIYKFIESVTTKTKSEISNIDNDIVESNYDFPDLLDNYVLKYKYEKNIAGVEYRNLDFTTLKNDDLFFEFEKNEFDEQSIKITSNGIHLGYIFKEDGMVRDMINNYSNNSNWKIFGWLKRIDKLNKKLTYQIAFYKKLNENDSILTINTTLTKITKKSESYLSSRYENLSILKEEDTIFLDMQDDSNSILVLNSAYEEIGELSEKVSNQLMKYIVNHYTIIAKISEIIEKDNGSLGAKINITVF